MVEIVEGMGGTMAGMGDRWGGRLGEDSDDVVIEKYALLMLLLFCCCYNIVESGECYVLWMLTLIYSP